MIEHVLAASTDSGDGAAVGVAMIVFLAFSIVCYFIPTIVALIRQVPNTGSVIVINFFLGWTLVGWVVALAMAVRSRT